MQYSILKMNKDFKLVISTDGFINSFDRLFLYLHLINKFSISQIHFDMQGMILYGYI